jgi:porin
VRRVFKHGLQWFAALAAVAVTGAAEAAPPPISIPAPAEAGAPARTEGPLDFLQAWRRNGQFFGDLWGLRPLLSQIGVTLAIQETSEGLGDATGGSRRSFAYEGLTQAVAQLDTQRAFGHYGGLFNVSVLDVHGRNLSAERLGTLQTASGIEADRGLRLWEAWYDQKFLEEDRLDLRIGQQSLDQEFMVSQNALGFVNTMFGWPMLPSADLPAGGPAYTLSALGLRVKARPTDSVVVLAGLFSGSPVKNLAGDPQRNNRWGLSFPLNRGALAIAEVQLVYPALGGMVSPGETEPLAHTYRLGAWYDTESFADQRRDQVGAPLASPSSSGVPAQHRGDYAFYAVADQMVWRSNLDPNRTLSLFGRAMATPLTNRNLIDASLNLGLVLRAPFAYRTMDTFSLGGGYAHVSRDARGADFDAMRFTGRPGPARSDETFVEATYQYQLTPWAQLQPDLQYVFNPGAGLANPNNPASRTRNELVFGLRANLAL